MHNKQLSDNFWLSEFNYVEPDPRLLELLQRIRNGMGKVVITDSVRTPADQVRIYKQLSRDKKIKTLENGLSDTPLIDVIPWGSRHLPSFDCPYLRAADINVYRVDGSLYAGVGLAERILLEAADMTIHIGLGVGKTYCHIDVDRTETVRWGYEY